MSSLSCLVIEDNQDHQEFLLDALYEAFDYDIEIHCYSRLQEGLDQLKRKKVDIFLCDLQLPDAPVTETVRILQNLEISAPIIILSSLNDVELAKSLVQKGIQDYLPKDRLLSPGLLSRTCLYAMERKHVAKTLASQNRDMRIFCHSLSHDFNALLRRIQFYSGELSGELSGRIQGKAEEYLASISSNVKYLHKLVSDLHDYLTTNREPDSHALLDMNQLIEEVLEIQQETIAQAGASIQVKKLPDLEGHWSQLLLLFQNLIINSIKFNHDKPVIKIGLQNCPNPAKCIITIEDNGIGIEQEYLEKVFEPFERLHSIDEFEGSGLGLSIVKRVIEQHAGDIWITSKPGKGSTFHVQLPLRQKQRQAPPQ